ncbi:hypothetical protein PG989_014062 [Apiospora arundinis]
MEPTNPYSFNYLPSQNSAWAGPLSGNGAGPSNGNGAGPSNNNGAGPSNGNGAGGNANLPSDPILSQPDLYEPRGTITLDLYKTLTYEGGIWLWSNQYGFEVLNGDQLYCVDEERGRITSRLAHGEWVEWNIAGDRVWIEDGTRVMYQAVQGPECLVDIHGQVFTPGNIRIDEYGRRYRMKSDRSWTLSRGFTRMQQNDNGTFYMTSREEGIPSNPDGWPVQLAPISQDDPIVLWQGLQSLYREPPRPEADPGATANEPLVASVALDRPGVPIPDPRLTNQVWQRIDRWLGETFPVDQYPAATNLDQRLRHMDAYFARQPAPVLAHPITQREKQDLWISVQVEVLVPCAWEDSLTTQTGSNGKLPIPIFRWGNTSRSAPPPLAAHGEQKDILERAMNSFIRDPRADGVPKRIASWTWQAGDIDTCHSVALTDDQSKWTWRLENKGRWTPPDGDHVDEDVNVQRWLISSPAFHMLDQQTIWPKEVAGMFNHLSNTVPWYVAPTSPASTVEIGPAKGCYFSTPQLRDMASFWYACEPYLTSLIPSRHVSRCQSRPIHGRCRAAWSEPAELASWLCRLTKNGSRFPAFPMMASKKMPVRAQSADDLAANGPDDSEAGRYGVDAGRMVARGTTALHNGISPAKDFFGRQPQDFNGNPTGRRENLFRLNRHRVINNIQRACSSPAVAMMMTASSQPFTSRGEREYLDLSNYAAPNLGETPRTAQNSIKIHMAPSTLYGHDIAAWMFIVSVVLQPAASDSWDDLCGMMPPPHELVRPPVAQNEPNAIPPEYQTRYSQKYDVFDLLYRLALPREALNYVENQMVQGWDGDGHMWGHQCARVG